MASHSVLALLVACMAIASVAATPQYQEQYTGYSSPSHSSYSNTGYQRRPSIIEQMMYRITGTDRQDNAGLLAAAPFLLLSLLAGIGLIIVSFFYYLATLNSSGRGLHDDEWEINHSTWMEQLNKDFEDSWSVE